MEVSIIVFSFVATTVLTAVLYRYALAKELIDIPNERSSHTIPTPRGGGLSIVLTLLFLLPVLVFLQLLNTDSALALGGAGMIVAGVGFFDDHGHIAPWSRLLFHFFAAGWGLAWLGGFSAINVFGFVLNLGWAGSLLAMFCLVWLLNLYNFMDGINGIASIETITVCLTGSFLFYASDEFQAAHLLVILAASVSGFLLWNFPIAKIFMGDAGSGFLGIVLGLFSIWAAKTAPALFWGWIILLGAFIVDASVTLIRRIIRGQKPHEAHRSHAYQFASRRLASHKVVSLAFGAINLFWLFPWAWAASMHKADGITCAIIAYVPLIGLAYYFNAGASELQETKDITGGVPGD